MGHFNRRSEMLISGRVTLIVRIHNIYTEYTEIKDFFLSLIFGDIYYYCYYYSLYDFVSAYILPYTENLRR